MKRFSVTVTVGTGSERHNHDISYRDTLGHTTGEHEKIIELIPYEKSYKEQINEVMKPYIDERNALTEARYQQAMQRFNDGKIKNKPKRKDYRMMDDDWYEAHKDDTYTNPRTKAVEKKKMFYSLIIGIGDQADKEKISLEEAKNILSETVNSMKQDFPAFHFLGATMHGDETGFWHMHVDVVPLYDKNKLKEGQPKKTKNKGLHVGINLDNSLKSMGYEPEQSIINQRDKAPILFNAMRNQIYRTVEKAMNRSHMALEYNVSQRKDPGKDSSKNQRLEDWQERQDHVVSLQHQKNNMLEKIFDTMKDAVDSAELISPLSSFLKEFMSILDKANQMKYKNTRKNIDHLYGLFNQLKSVLYDFVDFVGQVLSFLVNVTNRNKELTNENRTLTSDLSFTKHQFKEVSYEVERLTEENYDLRRTTRTLENENRKLKIDNHQYLDLLEKKYNHKFPEKHLERE